MILCTLVEHRLLTRTRIVSCIPVSDRALEHAHRELDRSIPLELCLIDGRGHSPIRRIVLKRQHASANRNRPGARKDCSAAAEPVGARGRVDQQHRARIRVVL